MEVPVGGQCSASGGSKAESTSANSEDGADWDCELGYYPFCDAVLGGQWPCSGRALRENSLIQFPVNCGRRAEQVDKRHMEETLGRT
jgi:hypothetical protein